MNIRFLTLAQQEVDEAVVWFEERAEGKGADFLDELDRTVRLVKTYPYASTQIDREIRRRLFARFPYSLVYGIDHNTIVVIAVAHSRRAPHYWVDRLRPNRG
ncbi:MAG TPA: type II toxin-antitoxin system RelE/ParE family toxin [Pyrinomonadaceae bacterium]|nr:type II toxin-antitoxin system RelE/ParE family toxin [Pyrinomonadaceae bacterium]